MTTPKLISFDAPPSDWDLERQRIKAERDAIAAAALVRQTNPRKAEMVSGHYVAPSWTEHLADAVSSYLGRKDSEALTKKGKEVAEQERKSLGEEVQAYMDLFRGTPGTPGLVYETPGKIVDPPKHWKPEPAQTFGLSQNQATEAGPAPAATPLPPFAPVPPPERQQLIGIPATPADPRAAMMQALMSQHPMMRALGGHQLQAMATASGEGLTDKDFLKAAQYLDPRSLVKLGAHPEFANLVMRNNLMTVSPDQAVLDKSAPGQFLPVTQNRQSQVTINGDLYNRDAATGGLKQIDNAPKITTIVGGPEKAYQTARGKAIADDVTAMVQQGRAAQQLLPTIDYLNGLNNKTTVSGPLADFSIATRGLSNMMGFDVDQNKLATDETYRSRVNDQIVTTFMNATGGAHGFTEMETKMLAQSYPQINMNPKARATVLGIMRAKALRDIDAAHKVQEQERANVPGIGGLPDTLTLPPMGAQPQPQPQPGKSQPLTPAELKKLQGFIQRTR